MQKASLFVPVRCGETEKERKSRHYALRKGVSMTPDELNRVVTLISDNPYVVSAHMEGGAPPILITLGEAAYWITSWRNPQEELEWAGEQVLAARKQDPVPAA